MGAWLNVNNQIEQAIQLANETPDLYERGVLSPASQTRFKTALLWANAFEQQVFETAGMAYLKGLIWTHLHDLSRAKKEYLRSLKLDPDGVDTLFDLGELYMMEKRYEDAKVSYQRVSDLVPTGPDTWHAPFRLAEIAGHQSNPDALELHLREAIRRGFPLAQLPHSPSWMEFYQEPSLRDKIYKLYSVYGDVRMLTPLEQ